MSKPLYPSESREYREALLKDEEELMEKTSSVAESAAACRSAGS